MLSRDHYDKSIWTLQTLMLHWCTHARATVMALKHSIRFPLHSTFVLFVSTQALPTSSLFVLAVVMPYIPALIISLTTGMLAFLNLQCHNSTALYFSDSTEQHFSRWRAFMARFILWPLKSTIICSTNHTSAFRLCRVPLTLLFWFPLTILYLHCASAVVTP